MLIFHGFSILNGVLFGALMIKGFIYIWAVQTIIGESKFEDRSFLNFE